MRHVCRTRAARTLDHSRCQAAAELRPAVRALPAIAAFVDSYDDVLAQQWKYPHRPTMTCATATAAATAATAATTATAVAANKNDEDGQDDDDDALHEFDARAELTLERLRLSLNALTHGMRDWIVQSKMLALSLCALWDETWCGSDRQFSLTTHSYGFVCC